MALTLCFKNSLQFPTVKEVDLEQLENLLEAEADAGLELEPGKDEIGDHGYVDLAQDGVFRGAYEGFEAKILLDEPEERLDLPSLLVDVGDGLGGEIEMVGQEFVEFSGFRPMRTPPALPEDRQSLTFTGVT